MIRLLAALLTLLVSVSAHADRKIYSCKDANGTAVFSSQPCGTDAKEVGYDAGHAEAPLPPGTIAPQPAKPQVNDAIRDISDGVADDDCRRNARNHAVYPTQQNIADLEQRKANLAEQASWARNNLAGAVYENGIRKQIGDIEVAIATERARISQESGRIDQAYRDDIAACDKAKQLRTEARRNQ